MEKSARTRLFTVVVLAVVFGAGIILGVAVGHSENAAPPAAARTDSATAAQNADSTGRRHRQPLYMQVNPTPQQKVRLDSILKENHDSMRVLNRDFHKDYDPHYDSLRRAYEHKYMPRYQAIISRTRAAIRRVLTPAQATKWDSLMTHEDSMRARADRTRRRGDRGGERGGDRGGARGDRGGRLDLDF